VFNARNNQLFTALPKTLLGYAPAMSVKLNRFLRYFSCLQETCVYMGCFVSSL